MNIVKSLHPGLLHKCFTHQGKHFFTVSILWGFNLQNGEPVLEQALWEAIGDILGKNEMFDAGMPKPRAEFIVHGSCFAPEGKMQNASRVSARLGDVNKQLNVYGDRYWIKSLGIGWGVTEPQLFSEMPVSYQNAFGGEKFDINPLGKGIDEVEGDTGPVIPLPNIEFPEQLIDTPGSRPEPASFNRIDLQCQQRMLRAGTYDQNYIETRMPGFPDDLNHEYFNDSAQDQWAKSYFNGYESYELLNMHPQNPQIKGSLPGVNGRCFVNRQVAEQVQFEEIKTNLDTVWFFPAAELGVLIHRGTIEVQQDDAADILQLLIANENYQDTARSLAHYEDELKRRTDLDEGFKYLMFTAPLIPENCTCGFKSMQESSNFPLEMLANQNMEQFSENKKTEAEEQIQQQIESMKSQLSDAGVDQQQTEDLINKIIKANKQPELDAEMEKLNALMEKVMPGAMEKEKELDLSRINLKAMDDVNDYMQQKQQQKMDTAKQQMYLQLDELKKSDASQQQVEQIEEIIKQMDLPPVLPRIDVEQITGQFSSQMEELEKQLVMMQSMGVSEQQLKEIRQAANMDGVEKQMTESLDKAIQGYRIGAHYIEQARSPHEGQEEEIRKQLLEAIQERKKTAWGDYAFVDFSGMNLTGIDLSGAYLEYANFSNTDLTDAKLSKAILSHAIVNNTNFTRTDLTEANLGSIDFNGAQFVDADLSEAILAKSMLRNTVFERCKMAQKMDMFLETRFKKTRFIDCDLQKTLFIDADISHCEFTGSDLSEINFINPIMPQANFSRAILAGATFIKADADGSNFKQAEMKNVRFVGECSLQKCDFTAAQVSEANLRDCNLQHAVFNEANLFKSDFAGSDLQYASFIKSKAVETQFTKANLNFAKMEKIDLMEGSLYKATLSSSVFANASLYGANLMDSTIGDTDFSGAFLEQTIMKDWRP